MRTLHSSAADLPANTTFPWIADGIAFGGDYSPEQWPEAVWTEDIALMQRAGVTSVNLGVFSWGLLEVADGVWNWEWLDRAMDALHEGGIGVNLATPTAAPPMWLLQAHPEIATVDEYGHRTAQGGRLAWSPSSAVFRTYVLRMVRALAERYGAHPALRLWHVSNEIGNENAVCYSDESGQAWRGWLLEKFEDIDQLNRAWGTAFWGHHYTSFDQIEPPRHARTSHNPGLLLDFERFTSDALIGHFRAERDLLREITPAVPITTNFIVMGSPGMVDFTRFAEEVDIIANDHYTVSADPERHGELVFSADRVRGLSNGRPWMVMEHSTAAVNWQPVNRAKSSDELARDSLAHVARGSDGALFFQWRASDAGAEQFHSAMLPHAGEDSQIFRDVERLGAVLQALRPIQGSVVERAQVALLFDHESVAALRSGRKPIKQMDALDMALALHRELTRRGIAVDVLPADRDLSGYDAVVIPMLYLVDDEAAARISEFVENGGHALVTYFSGIVNENNRVRGGGYPGAFRDMLGVRVDEIFPLLPGESAETDLGWGVDTWAERVEARGAEVLARLNSGTLSGTPMFTRNSWGKGTASYLAARVDRTGIAAVVQELIDRASISPVADVDEGLEVTRRSGGGRSWVFLINNTERHLHARISGLDLVSGVKFDGLVSVVAGGYAIIEEN